MSGTIVVEEITTRVVEVVEAGETIVVEETATQLVEIETAAAVGIDLVSDYVETDN